jgi:hypothetical protein
MGTTRYRYRLVNIDPKANNHGAWNSPIKLGEFQDLSTTFVGGVPHSTWGNPYNPQQYSPEVSALVVEQVWDELHRRSRRTSTGFTQPGDQPWYNEGGPFLLVRIDTGIPQSGVVGSGTYYNLSGNRRYVGGFMPPTNTDWGGWASTPLAFTGQSNDLLPDVAPYFDRAWRSAKPKLEMSSLYVFLREIGDTVPMLQTSAKALALQYNSRVRTIKFDDVLTDTDNIVPYVKQFGASLSSRNMRPKELAEHFINHEFGWAPFVGDIVSFCKTYLDASELIKKISDENGKWVRRSVGVTKDESDVVVADVTCPLSSSSYSVPCFPVGFPADFFTMPPSYKITEKTTLSIHAAGKFRFYRPEFDMTLPDYSSAFNKIRRAIKLYGLEVNPYHIWQATPWTWLIDWVTNLGSYIQRMSDSLEDQVAAQYFYITAHKRIVRTLSVRLPFANGLKVLNFERSYTSKQRVSADSPYGFRVSWDSLSPERLAILGALGITRRASGRGL